MPQLFPDLLSRLRTPSEKSSQLIPKLLPLLILTVVFCNYLPFRNCLFYDCWLVAFSRCLSWAPSEAWTNIPVAILVKARTTKATYSALVNSQRVYVIKCVYVCLCVIGNALAPFLKQATYGTASHPPAASSSDEK